MRWLQRKYIVFITVHVTCIFSAYRKESLIYCSPSAVRFPRAITSALKTLSLASFIPNLPTLPGTSQSPSWSRISSAGHNFWRVGEGGGSRGRVERDLVERERNLVERDLGERDLKPKRVRRGPESYNLGQTHLAAQE